MNDAPSSWSPAGRPSPWGAAPADRLGALAGQLVARHHPGLLGEAPRLVEALASAPVALRNPLGQLAGLLHNHLWKESSLLYPALGALPAEETERAAIVGTIRQHRFEHDRLLQLVDDLRGRCALAGAEAPALERLLDAVEAQVAEEEELLFPAFFAQAGIAEEEGA